MSYGNITQEQMDKMMRAAEEAVQSFYNKAIASGIPADKLTKPRILMNLRGTCAGVASARHIRLNPVLFWENWDDYLVNTIGHEVAHTFTDQVHGGFHQGKFRKIQPHGREWKSMMRRLGLEPTRTHSYDTSRARVKKTRKFKYKCDCREFTLGTKRHNKHQRFGENVFYCNDCRVHLRFVREVTDDYYGNEPKQETTQKTKTPSPQVGRSKKEIARDIYIQMRGKTRKEIIDAFVEQAGMTKAGASTYHSTFKKEIG